MEFETAAVISDIFTQNICFCLCSLVNLFPDPIAWLHYTCSLNHSGSGRGAKVVVISSFIWTTINRRRPVSFVDISSVVGQLRFFFKHVKRSFSACLNSQRYVAYAQTKFARIQLSEE